MTQEEPIKITERQLELMREFCPLHYEIAMDLQKTGDVKIITGAQPCKA